MGRPHPVDQRAHPVLFEDIGQATLLGRNLGKLGLDAGGSEVAGLRSGRARVHSRAHSASGLLDFGQIEDLHLLYSVGEREYRGSCSHREVRKDRAVRNALGRCGAGSVLGLGWV